MKTVYLDHNIVHYYVMGFPPNVDETIERRVLAEIDSKRDEIRIVFSTWNLIESSRKRPWDDACRLAQFIQDRIPYWIHDRRILQCDELRAFIFSQFFPNAGFDRFRVNAIRPTFSQMMHEWMPQFPALPNEQPIRFIRYLFDHQNEQSEIRRIETQTPEVLTTLQRARKDGHLTAGLNDQVIEGWLSHSMPHAGPDGLPLAQEIIQLFLAYCVNRYDEVLRECPCLQSEHLLADYRSEVATRNPQKQDAIDLMHMAPALAYCDAVVTNDGYLCSQGKRYARDSGRPVIVGRLLSHVTDHLL